MAKKKLTKKELIVELTELYSSLTVGQLEQLLTLSQYLIRTCMEMDLVGAGLVIVPRQATALLEKSDGEKPRDEMLKS